MEEIKQEQRQEVVVETEVKTPPPVLIRKRRLSDKIAVVLAGFVFTISAWIWIFPPLQPVSSPKAVYALGTNEVRQASVYSPVAVPARYYIELPETVLGQYQWFMVDFRSEVASRLKGPISHRRLGLLSVNRSGDRGEDLEFRKIDGDEWRVSFFEKNAVFSNSLLRIELKR